MQVELTKWLAYPENKPECNGRYLCITSEKNCTFEWYVYGTGFDKRFTRSEYKIIAFAEIPKPYDPTAKQFNFWTALEMMKESGEPYRCLDNGCEYWINNGMFYCESKGTVLVNAKLTYQNMISLWEVANAN